MNVKELKKLLSELPEECDELPVYVYADLGQRCENANRPTIAWINEDDLDFFTNDDEEAYEYGYTLKAVML